MSVTVALPRGAASAASLPPRLLRLPPAGASVAGRLWPPLEGRAFARRTQSFTYGGLL